MKKLLAIMLVGLSSAAYANLDLAKNNACLVCHAVDKKIVGPAYKDVAAKYAGKKDAVAYLTGKIRGGSSGVWGAVPMPANAHVSEADAKKLAEWILSQK